LRSGESGLERSVTSRAHQRLLGHMHGDGRMREWELAGGGVWPITAAAQPPPPATIGDG
ncbi:hypothetical protein LTR66_016751, partial [Elasticomyces elasticus]